MALSSEYASIAAGEGLLGRLYGKTLNASMKADAEAHGTAQAKSWLLAHADEPDYSGGARTAVERLADLEAAWVADDERDPDVVALAKAYAEVRYLQLQGSYDGRTGSAGFHRQRADLDEIWRAERALYRKQEILAGGETYPIRRFSDL